MNRRACILLALLIATSGPLAAPARALPTEALLDTLQHTAFMFFWNEANPVNGMIRDRSQAGSPASIASVGFGLSAIPIGIDHGWITREQGRIRALTTLQTLYNGPQSSAASGTIGYQGLFYHWLDMNTATRTWDSELSTIDTALLFAGMLDARQYFDGPDADETSIRTLADTVYRRANWRFMQNFNPGILMGWKPGTGFLSYGQWTGYNEATILYLLALGSPTKPPSPTNFAQAWGAWTSGYDWESWYGYEFIRCEPLFTHQYSQAWVDFRYLQDAWTLAHGTTYHENSRRATLAQRAYCIENPLGRVGYSDSLWGLTASDDPGGYVVHGAPPAMNDNGTITPTAALSSIVFTPNEALAVAHYLWDHYRVQLWGPYGFRDAFHLGSNWWGTDVIGIDQGPILLMIENYRTGRVWQRMMANADVQRGLQRAGFMNVTASAPAPTPGANVLLAPSPNPCGDRAGVSFRLAEDAAVKIELFDLSGRRVASLPDERLAPGEHTRTLDTSRLAGGVYFVRWTAGRDVRQQRLVRVR